MSNSSNVRKIVRIEAKPGLADLARAALVELQRATQTEPGCREFVFFQALGDESSFLLIEDFANLNALEHHMNLPHTQAFFARELVAAIRPIERGWMS
ncbi:putative quinol monooxygenase [Microvirga terricola]|uniref:Antibiotic biosynthesis monooxygenase n=1 Tax=Microvirga terricola TaxID=2719797 RepID=A0ABX0VDD9_9HYPH|nr:putative quinol monooxygenase [Microvirga terricola]NIX77179.1 antibiotic biosynthesis monooxygenase [Microvirga terricola]